MATRLETQQRKQELKKALDEECRGGRLTPGSLVPSVRELSARHRLSKDVVHLTLQELVREGLLYTVPGVGTFAAGGAGRTPAAAAATPVPAGGGCFLAIADRPTDATAAAGGATFQGGFAERIAALGGASIVLPEGTLEELVAQSGGGPLPAVEGVCGFFPPAWRAALWGGRPGDDLPVVAFFGHAAEPGRTDMVSFDDEGGGRQAAEHLLALGHRRVAFIGVHRADGLLPDGDGRPDEYRAWSVERQRGWEAALAARGLSREGLAFHIGERPEALRGSESAGAGLRAGRALAARGDVSAVVAANDRVAAGLFEGLRECGVAEARWPAVVGFDDLPQVHGGAVLTSLRPPWEEAGRVAADLVWARRHGQLAGPPVHRKVPMRLLTRLSSLAGWSAGGLGSRLAPTVQKV